MVTELELSASIDLRQPIAEHLSATAGHQPGEGESDCPVGRPQSAAPLHDCVRKNQRPLDASDRSSGGTVIDMNCREPRCALHADIIGNPEHLFQVRETVAVLGTNMDAIASLHQRMDEAYALNQRIRHID